MTLKSKILFGLELLFLGLIFSYTFSGTELVSHGFSVLSFRFNVLWGNGVSSSHTITTAFIGYVFAILFNLSLKEKARKSNYIFCILGLLSFLSEAFKFFYSFPLNFTVEPAALIVVLDILNVRKIRKSLAPEVKITDQK